MLATLLDLVDRGYYDGKASEGEELDLRLSIPEERPPLDDLTEYEREAIEFFDGLLEEGPGDLGKLKDRVPKHSSKWRTKWEELRESLDRAEEGQLGWDRDLTRARSLLAFVALAGYIVIGLAYWDRTHQVAIPIFAALAGLLFIYLQPATSLKRLEPASRARHAQWNSFARWTNDFPRLSRRPAVDAQALAADPRLRGRVRHRREGDRLGPDPGAGDARGHDIRRLAGSASGWGALRRHAELRGLRLELHQPGRTAIVLVGGGGGFSGGGGGFSGGGGGGAW